YNILHEVQIKEFPSESDTEAFYEFALQEKRIESFFNQVKNQMIDNNGFENKQKNNNKEYER
ncbi:hypothetical protein, partial [Pseudogracilibacillus sp. SO30301A]|uniref:hypothetical protein n=1 Tax=Pseudogracilibacillus sp. SO30301A TaxID=3098291 RepID=UPI00300E4586